MANLRDAITALTANADAGTLNAYATNELPVDMHPRRLDSHASLTALSTLLSRIEETEAFNYRVDWVEQNEIPTTVMVATGESIATTTIYVVANGTTLVKDTLLYNPDKNDIRRVTATPTTNTVAVAVSQGGTTSSAWEAGDVLFVMLPALAEDDESYRTVSVADSNQYNYTQLAKLQFSITRVGDRMKTHFEGKGGKRAQLQ